jgi:polyvinyl alcohol dehydrogenase (cytochrome)
MYRIADAVIRAVCSLTTCGILLATAAVAVADDGQWTMGGQDLHNWRSQDATALDPSNVARLKTKWVFTTGGDVSAIPAVADGRVYFPDFAGNFYAVNARTGALVWRDQLGLDRCCR